MNLLRRQFNLTGITDPGYRFVLASSGSLSSPSAGKRIVVAGIGDAGILGARASVKNLFEKKK
jgi:hypothetical protein